MKSSYHALAGVYDSLNRDIDYGAIADFADSCFSKYSVKRPELVLDLGCGTGAMTIALAKKGYDMTGIDISPEMLSKAYRNAAENGFSSILFLEQDMCSFELYGTVDAAVCCLDGINHLLSEEDVKDCFACVHNYLIPNGIFVFDVNTPYKFKNIYADNDYVLEAEDALCVWQNRLSDDGKQCDFHLSVFEKMPSGLYSRKNEVTSEMCYLREEIENALKETGFEILEVSSGFSHKEAGEKDERWNFAVRAKK